MKALAVNHGVPPGTPVLRKSFRSLARDLHVDQGTIRRRMRKFHEQGILTGWFLGTSPSVTGHSVAHVWLEIGPDSDKRELMGQLLTLEGVERVCSYLGPKLSLILLYREKTDLDASLEGIAKIAGSGKVFHEPGANRKPDLSPPSETDLAIIESLRQDPWKPHEAVARELGMSSRTVKRRIAKLSDSGTIYMLPDIDLKALHGIIPAELVVHYGPSKSHRDGANQRIVSQIRDELVFSDVSESHGYFALNVSNASRVEQIARWVRQQEGVRQAHADVLQEVVLNRTYYKRALGRVEIKEGQRPGRRAVIAARRPPAPAS